MRIKVQFTSIEGKPIVLPLQYLYSIHQLVYKMFTPDIDEKAMPRKPFSFRGMGKGLVVCLYLCYDCIG